MQLFLPLPLPFWLSFRSEAEESASALAVARPGCPILFAASSRIGWGIVCRSKRPPYPRLHHQQLQRPPLHQHLRHPLSPNALALSPTPQSIVVCTICSPSGESTCAYIRYISAEVKPEAMQCAPNGSSHPPAQPSEKGPAPHPWQTESPDAPAPESPQRSPDPAGYPPYPADAPDSASPAPAPPAREPVSVHPAQTADAQTPSAQSGPAPHTPAPRASHCPSSSFRSRVSTFPRSSTNRRSGRIASNCARRRGLFVPTRASSGSVCNPQKASQTNASRASARGGTAAITNRAFQSRRQVLVAMHRQVDQPRSKRLFDLLDEDPPCHPPLPEPQTPGSCIRSPVVRIT